jgi:hypothetical protein
MLRSVSRTLKSASGRSSWDHGSRDGKAVALDDCNVAITRNID